MHRAPHIFAHVSTTTLLLPSPGLILVGAENMVDEGSPCPVCFGVGCGGNGDRIHRHDSIRDALFSAAQSAPLAPGREAPSLIPAVAHAHQQESHDGKPSLG